MTPKTITIPAAVVTAVHEAALYKLGRAADEIHKQTERRNPDLWEALQLFDTLRALVEATSSDYGMSGRADESAVEVAMDADVLVDALTSWVQITAALVETAVNDDEYTRAGEHASELAAVTDFIATLREPVPA